MPMHVCSAQFQPSARRVRTANGQIVKGYGQQSQSPAAQYRASRSLAANPPSTQMKVKPRIPNIMFDHTRVPEGCPRLPRSGSTPAATPPAGPNISTIASRQQWRQLAEWLGSVGKRIDRSLFVAARDGWARHDLHNKVNQNPDRSNACAGYLVLCRSTENEVFGGYQGTPQLFVSPHKHRSQ